MYMPHIPGSPIGLTVLGCLYPADDLVQEVRSAIRCVSEHPTGASDTTHSTLVGWDLPIWKSEIPTVGKIHDTGNNAYENRDDEDRRQERVPADQVEAR